MLSAFHRTSVYANNNNNNNNTFLIENGTPERAYPNNDKVSVKVVTAV